MPFKSEAQRRWMYEKHPDMAKRWEADTSKDTKLPERADSRKRGSRKGSRIQQTAKRLLNRPA